MTCRIITVVNQKGGSGKTTTAMQLAGTLGRRKHKVLVVDADPQNTAIRWSASADEAAPFPASVIGLDSSGKKIHQEIRKFIDDYDFIIVDCPPSIESAIPQSALLISDLAIIPVIPSPADLWATVGIKKLIELVMPLNEDLKALIVVNMCQANVTLSNEVSEALKEFELPIARTHIGQRTAFRKSAIYGQTVHALGTDATKAIEEVEAFATEILELLK
jgi:chromosome partitioning protein